MISIEKVRANGGYWVPVASQSNNFAPTWIDTPQGKTILLSGTTAAMKWVPYVSTTASGSNTNASGEGQVNAFRATTATIDAFGVSTLKMLTNEYKAGADVIEIAQSVKAVSRLGKISIAINISSVGYDLVSGNVHTSTLTDATMIGVGVVIGVAIGPIAAGVVGLIYGGAMIFGGQDAINNAFDGNWNLELNKTIQNIY
jgi:hypothetical protein